MADFRDRYALARLLARGWVRKDTSVPPSEASPTCLPRHEWNRHLTAEVADDGASAFSGEAGTRKQKRSVDFVAIQLLPRVVLKEEQLQSESDQQTAAVGCCCSSSSWQQTLPRVRSYSTTAGAQELQKHLCLSDVPWPCNCPAMLT